MPIEVQHISEVQKLAILSVQEGHFVDLKAKEIRPAKLSEFISSFANADGGELFIGIDEDKTVGVRTWRGFED